MLRYVIGILITILAVTFLRIVIGLITRTANEALNGKPRPAQPSQSAERPPEKGAMLRKCQGCGTFAPEDRMLRRGNRESDVFFCSRECEQKVAA